MKKMSECVSPDDTLNQMMYVSGLAVRQAAVTPPEKLERYLAQISAPVM